MVDPALIDEEITVEWNTVVEEILCRDGVVAGVRVRDAHTGAERILDVTRVFVAIGHDPRSELFRGPVDPETDGYVTAGNGVDHTYRQAITATGTGCAAALTPS